LAARDRERVRDRPRRGFPEPVPDLVVVRLDLSGLHDVRVVAKAVEELRPVRLWVDRLQLDALDVRLLAWAVSLRLHVEAALAFPDAGHPSQRSEILQRIDVDVRRFGVDVFGELTHGSFS